MTIQPQASEEEVGLIPTDYQQATKKKGHHSGDIRRICLRPTLILALVDGVSLEGGRAGFVRLEEG